ncbi:MAG: hypothetical protein OEV49_06525 [candidate division Zixibacteria bacterium]|nr:hypothetical protein [candidate division Zixibacteria bacterium]MDH3935877.1 hypothetical protein [candidate division Zixibacteria bacterium]MDH4034964.1 hypothetical protein [candidate division Zixibacteria bacterium]
MKKTLLLLVALSLIHLRVWSAGGIEGAIAVYQTDEATSENHLLFADTNRFVTGMPVSGFLLTFSVDIELESFDTTGCEFSLHIITLGPTANTYSRNFKVEYGLPARIENIQGKGSSRYRFEFTPLQSFETDSAWCSYSHRQVGVFNIEPSAHLDIHYLPNTLGDFYWGAAKGILEEHYTRIQTLYNFTLPGKYDIYLCPCYIPSVIWDKRFATAVDPTRTTAHAIFTHALNSADPFVLAHTVVLRNYGYAPPFLSEGLANYLSLALFDMKEIVAQKKNLPLDDFLDTYQYYTADPYLADRTGATFVMFLVNQYGFPRFKQLYEAADDLNLRRQIERHYDASIIELENQWRTYVDTSRFDIGSLVFHAGLAEAMFDYRLMLRYAEAVAELSRTHQDSLGHLSLLKRAYFYSGDYYSATAVQEQLVQLQSSSAKHWMTLGTYRMMNGYYDQALEDLSTAFNLDTSDHNVRFNLAMNYDHRGERAKAREHLQQVVNQPTKAGPHVGSMIILGHILRESEDEKERALGQQYLLQAIRGLEATLQSGPPAPSTHLWLGMACIGVDEFEAARGYLEGALFLETRPFYLGMSHLWLGKLADLTGLRDEAVGHYSEVLALTSAAYHQAEAQRHLKTPYTR